MDGLTIRAGQSLIDTGKTSSEIRNDGMSRQSGVGGADIGAAEGGKSFADTLKDAVGQVNTLQKESDTKMQQLATGKTSNIPDVMMSAEKADIALRLMVQVRNKMIEAYQEVMKMQV